MSDGGCTYIGKLKQLNTVELELCNKITDIGIQTIVRSCNTKLQVLCVCVCVCLCVCMCVCVCWWVGGWVGRCVGGCLFVRVYTYRHTDMCVCL